MTANPNRVQTCQSAGPHGIGKYDCSCPITVSQGVQCRTMLSQRPCGNPQCTREECSGARLSAQVFMDGTKDSTENGSMGSESAPAPVLVLDTTDTLHTLSESDRERIALGLFVLMDDEFLGSDEWHALATLRDKFI